MLRNLPSGNNNLAYSFVDVKTGSDSLLLFFLDPEGKLTDQLLDWFSSLRWSFNSKMPLPALFITGMIKVREV
jgi:hypothetical protein